MSERIASTKLIGLAELNGIGNGIRPIFGTILQSCNSLTLAAISILISQVKVEVPVTDNDLYPEWVGGGSDSRKPPQIRVIQVVVEEAQKCRRSGRH